MGKYEVQVTASALNCRTGPSTSYKSIGILYKGAKYTSSKQSNGWYYIDSKKGWSSGVSTKYLKVTKNLSETSSPPKSVKVPTTKTEKTTAATATQSGVGIDAKVLKMLTDSIKSKGSKMDASMRLFGSPFQFDQSADFRVNGGRYDLGRKYIDTIISESPIVHILPGRPSFLPGTTSAEKDAMKSFLGGQSTTKDNQTAISKLLNNNDVRYFDFLADYSTYIRYVNLLCRVMAIYMGLGDLESPVSAIKTKYKWFDWSNYRYQDSYKPQAEKIQSVFDLKDISKELAEKAYDALFGTYQYVQFYVDPSTSFSESSSNQSATSKLAGVFETGQDLVKEISFLMNTGATASATANSWTQSTMDNLSTYIEKVGNTGLFSRLTNMSAEVISGSNIVFPEMWGNAAYNKSYNVTVNLVSPYGDKESIYLNIMVPLMHLIALALPRQTSANSFTNPFLVKVSSKGWFNCEMGMVENISIEKVQKSWSVNGLPTEVKVQLSIKDLYGNLMMTSNSQPGLFFENKGLMNWLAVTCGVDITTPNFSEKWSAILLTLLNSAVDMPSNTYNSVIEYLRENIINRWSSL